MAELRVLGEPDAPGLRVLGDTDTAAPVSSQAERDRAIAETKARGGGETTAQRFRRGFSEGFGGGAPLGEAIAGGPIPLVTQPVRALGSLVSGVTRGVQETLPRDIAAMPEAFYGSPGSLATSIPKGMVSEAIAPSLMGGPSKAERVVNKAFQQSVKGGQTTALDVIDKMSAARQADQPLTLSDIGGKPIQRLAGTVYRSGGEPAAYMERFYKGRGTDVNLDHLNTAAGTRIEKAIGENIATGSFKQASKDLIAERSARARPLWEEATAGGSVAPLEKQFEAAFNDAAAAERQAAQNLARAKATQSEYPQRAVAELTRARNAADDARARLRQAQDDGTANAPGAVWSPRLQEFLNLPNWQEGIRRGLAMERTDAVTEGRPFNPSEYAIVGEKEGEPVIGAVPTMKLLQVAKEGIAAKIDDMRDPLTGALSKAGRSLWLNLKAFEAEGYKLNPAWKAANDAWSGDSASIRALQLGKKIFSMPAEDLAADFRGMSESDKELFKLSAASKAIEDVRKTPFSADPSKRVINTPDEARRLRVLFDNNQDFKKFFDYINRERVIFETPGEVMKGSQTAERTAADAAGIGMDVAHSASRLATGHIMSAIAPLVRAAKGMGLRQDPKLNLEIAKILTNPDLTVADSPMSGLLGGTIPFQQEIRK